MTPDAVRGLPPRSLDPAPIHDAMRAVPADVRAAAVPVFDAADLAAAWFRAEGMDPRPADVVAMAALILQGRA